MLTIDASHGEGGGQVVRTAVALSVVTGTQVAINQIRAGRQKPGLARQHLTAVGAAATICNADVNGAELGSRHLVFRPNRVRAGDYQFRVGTAGSATLVLQTVLPALLVADGTSWLTLEGGTHNPWAPPFDFLERTFLPLVRKMGPAVDVKLERPGFYPAGGGRFRVAITPAARLAGIELLLRGEITARRVRAWVANLPRHIGQRECDTIRRLSRWPEDCFAVEEISQSAGPGNVVMIDLVARQVTEVVTSFGRRGVRAEKVAREAWREAQAYLDADVPVGPHLADQLILPLAMAAHAGGGAGKFCTLPLTPHAHSQIDIVKQFLNVDVDIEAQRDGTRCLVTIGS